MDIEFRNVTIAVTAESAQAGYDELCRFLAKSEELAGLPLEFSTDTYVIFGPDGRPVRTEEGNEEERDTCDLWPPCPE